MNIPRIPLSRRRLLQGAGTVAVASVFPKPAFSQVVRQPRPAGTESDLTLTVGSAAGPSIPPYFMGLSYEKYRLGDPYFNASNTEMIGMFKSLGAGVLRIGGDTEDKCFWTPTGPEQFLNITQADVDNLAAFLSSVGWKCLYGVNMPNSSASVAAAEVTYVAGAIDHSLLLGIEIGNEPDGYTTDSYVTNQSYWNTTNFFQQWVDYRAAIVADVSVPFTGPATSGKQNIETWTGGFAQDTAIKGNIALLTQHYYRATTLTDDQMISPDNDLQNIYLPELQSIATTAGCPYRITECNSLVNNGVAGVSDAYASTLWVIDFLFNCVMGGASGVNLQGGGPASTIHYTPISDTNGTALVAQPLFYGLKLFQMFGTGNLLTTTLGNLGSLKVTAYTVETANGVNILISNKSSTNYMRVTMTLPQNIASGTAVLLTAPALSSTSGVTIQGGTITSDGTFDNYGTPYTPYLSGATCYVYVPINSVLLITLTYS